MQLHPSSPLSYHYYSPRALYLAFSNSRKAEKDRKITTFREIKSIVTKTEEMRNA